MKVTPRGNWLHRWLGQSCTYLLRNQRLEQLLYINNWKIIPHCILPRIVLNWEKTSCTAFPFHWLFSQKLHAAILQQAPEPTLIHTLPLQSSVTYMPRTSTTSSLLLSVLPSLLFPLQKKKINQCLSKFKTLDVHSISYGINVNLPMHVIIVLLLNKWFMMEMSNRYLFMHSKRTLLVYHAAKWPSDLWSPTTSSAVKEIHILGLKDHGY